MFKHFAGLWLGIAVSAIPLGRVEPASAQPVCPIEDQAHCQSAATGQFILPSDRLLGIRRADDFRPAGSTISHLCFFPCFIGVTAPGQGFECFAEGETPPDDYILKIYEDDFGIPGLLAAGIPANGLALTIDAKANLFPPDGSRCWRYSAAVAPPMGITITPNECYWLEVTGMGEMQAQGQCIVHVLSSAHGNNFSMSDDNDLYAHTDFELADCAFCVDSGFVGATNPPASQDGGCGDFSVACCKPGPSCEDGGTYSQCVGTSQAPIVAIPFPFVTCSDIGGVTGCPIPQNDLCQNAIYPVECQNQEPIANPGICLMSGGIPSLYEPCDLDAGIAPNHDCVAGNTVCQPSMAGQEAYHCRFEADNQLASTDGPSTQGGAIPSCFGSGVNSFQADVWFRYIAPCNGYLAVINCGFPTYDSMVQVYGNHTPTCTPCPIASNSQSLGCSDDNCSSTGDSSSEIRINGIKAGACYTIRLGGWSQTGTTTDAGQKESGLDIGMMCDIPLDPPLPAPSPHDRKKNRYISFVPLSSATAVAYRVDKMNPNAGTCWVSPPDILGNSKCGTAPALRFWNEPVVHLGDCEIAPDNAYRIFTQIITQFGWVTSPNALEVRTIDVPVLNGKFWGDVAGTNNGVEWTPPNLFTNVNDVLAVLAYISNAPIRPTFQVVNLQAISSADPCLNAFVNTADVLIVVKAAAGDAYPFTTNPANCPSCP